MNVNESGGLVLCINNLDCVSSRAVVLSTVSLAFQNILCKTSSLRNAHRPQARFRRLLANKETEQDEEQSKLISDHDRTVISMNRPHASPRLVEMHRVHPASYLK